MEYVGFVLGIFGLIAYLQAASLKKRVADLENDLAKTEGSRFFTERQSLRKAAGSYVGRRVRLDLKEDCEDVDIMMYGNSKHGSNTILDADDEWLLVRIESPRGTREKLIRIGSVQRISATED